MTPLPNQTATASQEPAAKKPAAKDVRGRERDLEMLLGAVNETVFTLDTAFRVTEVHGRHADDLPVPARDIIGKTPAQLLGHTAAAWVTDLLQRALDSGSAEIEREVALAGQPTSLRVWCTRLGDKSGAIVGLMVVAYDMTAQRNAERERDVLRSRLEESHRIETIGRLVSGIAHEINNPLAAILTFAEQLRFETRSAIDAAALDAIRSEAIRSRAIVRDLLAYVRTPDDRAVTPVRPGPLLDDLLRSLVPHVMSLGVDLTWDEQDESVWVAADVAGIEQVVTNLVLNAAQSAAPSGRVSVRTPQTGDVFTIAVEDSGIGIAPAAIPLLFEPFFTTKPVGTGTGLGLFVARGIVQRHGGTLRAENRPEGGARFTVELLKVAAPAEFSAGRVARTIPVPSEVNARVLLIDDEDSIRISLKRFFTRRGWQVFEARDGQSALAVLRTEDPDSFALLLCDLRMPGMGGPELYETLKFEFPQLLSRLVLVSGDVVSAETAKFIAGTDCVVLEKPFELRTLGALADDKLALLHAERSSETV
jgi:signal transduction histidine kinase/ActR/RegA family two-component response regulator